jgi:hypothetical protein
MNRRDLFILSAKAAPVTAAQRRPRRSRLIRRPSQSRLPPDATVDMNQIQG